ncbi:FAS1 domain-containing protein, partial [Amylocarpus encephaloides]
MRVESWTSRAATALGLLIGGAGAQTGSLTDLGTLLSGQTNLTTFYTLIQKYPQILFQLPSQNGVTILAPNNDAFNKIPYTELNVAFQSDNKEVITNVLEYHILKGSRTAAQLVPGDSLFIPTLLTSPAFNSVTGGARVENIKQAGDSVVFVSGKGSRSTVVQTDLLFNGGVIQVLDSLLIPPANLTDTTTSFNLTAFQGALYSASKVQNFTSTANCTIFVPQNAAFQALGPAISHMSISQLSSVLDYHLIPSSVLYTTSLTNGTSFATAQGGKVTIRHAGNNVYVNSAQLLTANILLQNGVLHVLDNVLNPEGPGAVPDPQIASQAPVFASASMISSLPFTTAIPCTTSCTTSPASSSGGGPGAASGAGPSTAGGTKTTGTARASGVTTSSSKAFGAMMARETGMGAAGLVVALGGA